MLLQLPAKYAISTIEATALVWLSTTKKCMVAAWRREEEGKGGRRREEKGRRVREDEGRWREEEGRRMREDEGGGRKQDEGG